MAEKKNIRVEVSITVKPTGYGDQTFAQMEVKKQLDLNTDSSKRKIIDEVEDIIDRATREVSDNLHHSSGLTDGEVARQEVEEARGNL